MRRLRAANLASGIRQYTFSLPQSVVEKLDRLKQRHGIKSRDRAAAAMIRRASDLYKATDIALPPAPPPSDPLKRIVLNLQAERAAYLQAIASNYRGASLSLAFEAIAAVVTDLAPAPTQLSLQPILNQEIAVSG